MLKWTYILILLFSYSVTSAFQLSDRAEISLITCSAGEAPHTLFGHSAIRVNDPVNGFDKVFNYGTFDFQQPDFLLNFIQGRLNYFLSVSDFDLFLRVYIRSNRSVFEHILNLDSTEKQAIFDFLIENYKPENRYYLYDFFYDNCSSRIRDVFESVLGDSLLLSHEYAEENKSFRDLIDPYIEEHNWIDLGIYLILGSPSDVIATPSQYMFLPDYLDTAFAKGQIYHQSWEPLSSNDKILFKREKNDHVPGTYPFNNARHLFWFIFLFIFLLSLYGVVKGKNQIWTDFLIFLIFGILGVLFLFFWFGTDHTVLPKNYNLLWAPPTHLIAAFLLLFNPKAGYLRVYFFITVFSLAFMLLFWNFIPQAIHEAIVPLAGILIIRSLFRVNNSYIGNSSHKG